MRFLTPAAFALTTLLPVIIAMYFLKLRRENFLVSSVYLWQQLTRDYEANAPWQRLRRNLLLFLQLLFLSALILALARPFFITPGPTGQSLILIIDTSASMAATDGEPTRLEAAKARARDLVDQLPDDARVTLIAAGRVPTVLLSNTSDRRQARDMIDQLQFEYARSDLATALNLAGAVAARQTQAEIIILSDGRVDLQPTELPASVRYIPIGQRDNNQAVSALSLRELVGGQAVSLFARVSNHARQPTTRRLGIYVNNQLFNVHELSIPAGESAAIIQDDLPAMTQIVEARLQEADDLPLDDRAWGVRPATQPAPVLLVSEGNLFLETALSLLPSIELTTIQPTDYATQASTPPASNTIPHLTIFDRTVPPGRPASNAFFISPPAPTAWFTPTGQIETPNVQILNGEDPLLRYVDLSQLQILTAAAIPLPAWARPLLITSDRPTAPGAPEPAPSSQAPFASNWPLFFAGEVDGRRVAVLTFDLRNSDLALRPAFPILLTNLIDFLVPGSRGVVPPQVQAGDPVELSLPPGVASVVITHPDGHETRLQPAQGRLTFADTEMPGIYFVTLFDEEPGPLITPGNEHILQTTAFAVNLFSAAESAIATRATLPLAGRTTSQAATPAQSLGRRELWRPIALLALAFLLLEWLVYQRAALAQLWHRPFGLRRS